ncbi:hypothetical protein [Amycolatopsis japonica]
MAVLFRLIENSDVELLHLRSPDVMAKAVQCGLPADRPSGAACSVEKSQTLCHSRIIARYFAPFLLEMGLISRFTASQSRREVTGLVGGACEGGGMTEELPEVDSDRRFRLETLCDVVQAELAAAASGTSSTPTRRGRRCSRPQTAGRPPVGREVTPRH